MKRFLLAYHRKRSANYFALLQYDALTSTEFAHSRSIETLNSILFSESSRRNKLIMQSSRNGAMRCCNRSHETSRTESVMSTIFPAALLACIAEGRNPSSRELATITAKVQREAFDNARESGRRKARTIACAALGGSF